MPYADYAYYSGTYQGTAISEDAFAALVRRASLVIDEITFNRLNSGWTVTDAVRMATCAVAEALKQYEAAEQSAVSAAGLNSENNDGYSISYQDAKTVRAAIDSTKLEAARPYLIYTGLMDRGVCT